MRKTIRLLALCLPESDALTVVVDWDGLMLEDTPDQHPIRQMNDYAISKWVNELQVGNSMAVHGTETVLVRLFNSYGPGETYSEYRSVICQFIYRALHHLPYTVYLQHRRTSSYVDNTNRTLVSICQRFKPGAVYDVAGKALHDVKTVSDTIWRACGKTDRLVSYVERGVHNTRDTRTAAIRAEDDLGHHETVGLEEGIARTIAWQREYYGR